MAHKQHRKMAALCALCVSWLWRVSVQNALCDESHSGARENIHESEVCSRSLGTLEGYHEGGRAMMTVLEYAAWLEDRFEHWKCDNQKTAREFDIESKRIDDAVWEFS